MTNEQEDPKKQTTTDKPATNEPRKPSLIRRFRIWLFGGEGEVKDLFR